MNARLTLMFVVALLLAGASAWFAKQYITSRAEQKPQTLATVPVVVATVDIPFAAKLTEPELSVVQFPKDAVPAGYFSDPKQAVGKVVQRSFLRGEVITAERLRDHLGGSTLSAMIKEGMRAISVRVDDVAGVAGFILPGNRVDILSSQAEGGTFTLLGNVNVLAVDQEASPEKNKPAVVRALTLEVTPQQAEILDESSRKGPLRFTLRNPSEGFEGERQIGQVFEPPKSKPVAAAPATESTRSEITVVRWGSGGGSVVHRCKDEQC